MSKFIDRTGEVNYNKQGEKMTIIRYGNAKDIDIQFEDGVVIYNRNYSDFKIGKVKHPLRREKSLAYNYPKIAEMIAIEENNLTFKDCYEITCYSNKKFYFKCLECGAISSKPLTLNNIINQGYSCKICSDGISIPNKFIYNLLTKLEVNFDSEYSPYYFKQLNRVDFLLIDYNIIVEMDGGYGNHTREYDYWRDFLNMKYGGYKTIRIDLKDDNRYRRDLFNYLKEQIVNSELSDLFDLSNINWELVWEQCQNSLCVKTWEIWNDGIHDTAKIAKILDLNRSTVIDYLKRGAECSKCDYSKEESYKVRGKKRSGKNNSMATKVICITTGEVFNTLTEGAEKYKIKSVGNITSCCKDRQKYCGKLEDRTPLVWRYIITDHNKILRGKDISKLHKINKKVA